MRDHPPAVAVPTSSAYSEMPIPMEHAVGLLRSWTNQTVSVWVCGSAQVQMAASMRGDICEVEVTSDHTSESKWIEVHSDRWTLKASGATRLQTGDDGALFAVTITCDDKVKTVIRLA